MQLCQLGLARVQLLADLLNLVLVVCSEIAQPHQGLAQSCVLLFHLFELKGRQPDAGRRFPGAGKRARTRHDD